MRQLFDELKRRNVIRVAVAYAVASWIVLQIADLVLENIGAPAWVMQAFMLLLGLGFPLVIIFSWAYEMTPEGLKRETDIAPDQSITHHTAHKLDRVIIGLLVLVVVMFAAERFVPRDEAAGPVAATITEVTDKSIAVLAFQDLSPGGDQAYFAEGISEELLNVLAQIPDLKVAGRTSSFAFKDQNRDLREIGEILEVAHILEGSVRTSGDRVRVTAQLVKANDGFHLFSRNYDRDLTDIFQVQDDIAREIAAALRPTLMGEQAIETTKQTSVEAYEKYLQARQWIHTRDRSLMEQASVLLDEALVIDPDYPPALAQKALSLMLLSNSPGSYGDVPARIALEQSRPLLDRALELNPKSAEAHAILGLWYRQSGPGYEERAIASLRTALEIAPRMANANNWLAGQLRHADEHIERMRLFESVVENDPLFGPAFNNVIFSYMQTQSVDKASALVRRVERIRGESPDVLFARGSLAMAEGRLADSVESLAKSYEFNPSGSVRQLWYGTALQYLGDYDTASKVFRPTDRLVVLEMAGRHEDAVAEFDSLDLFALDEGQLRGIGDWMLLDERPADFVAFLEQQLDEGQDLVSAQPIPQQLWGTSNLTNIALALEEVGRESDARRALVIAETTLEAQARNGANNLFYWYSRAEYDAISGDIDSMLVNMRKAIDSGNNGVAGFYTAPFNRYRGDSRFIELDEESRSRANAERQKLGLQAI